VSQNIRFMLGCAKEGDAMQIFARQDLVTGRLDELEPAVLLEGSWSVDADVELRQSLDDEIDARFRWIDDEAARIAQQLGATRASHASVLSLNAARLRYQLVKWLRLVAWFEKVARFRPGAQLRAILERHRDLDYGRMLQALATKHGCHLIIRWEQIGENTWTTGTDAQPVNEWWRRILGQLNRATDVSPSHADLAASHVLLCGNPRHLDPVCGELTRRGARSTWLYDRFAVGSWLRWRWRGVGQFVCDRELESIEPLPLGLNEGPVESCGLDLRGVLEAWLEQLATNSVQRQSQLAAQVNRALDTIRPTIVVVDQDATPLNRALVLAAKSRGIKTCVVQHGVPFVSFGFAPVEADTIYAWGETSRQQLVDWGVSREQIVVTGSPAHDAGRLKPQPDQTPPRPEHRPPRFLLLGTMPPQDTRPDLVAYHCTGCSYGQMLRMALGVLNEYDEATVLVKPHPRDTTRRLWHRLLGDFPALDSLLVERGSIESFLAGADCVLACASSSGVEATMHGVPVVQLMPTGSRDLIDAVDWGMLGSARSADQLRTLIDRALYDPTARPEGLNASVIGASPQSSAAQIVDHLLLDKLPSAVEPADIVTSVS
jgi:hypothetical protein